MTKRAMLWTGTLLMVLGVAAAVVFLALPNPGSPSAPSDVPPPTWHDTGTAVGFGITCFGAVLLMVTQVRHWEPDE